MRRAVPAVHHATLASNGLRVITVPQPHLHSATVSMFVKVGSRYESERENGLSHLLEHMLFRGSARHPTAHALNRAIEELGGTLNAATQSDSTVYEVTLPPSNVLRGIEILGELFDKPRFARLAIEKKIIREELLEQLDEDGRDVDPDNLARRAMFGTHPLGMSIAGSRENLDRFSVRDLRAHMQRHYVARNMLLCVAGAVQPTAVARAARAGFSHLAPGAATQVSAPSDAPKRSPLKYIASQGSQSDVRLSFATPGSNDPRYLALELLARVIDDGMSTRLHRRICEELGLAYEVFASLEPYEECGVLDVGGAVEHHNVPRFVRTVLRLLAELTNELVTRAELDKAKHRYAWQLDALLDDSQAMSTHYGQRALLGQDADLQKLRAALNEVTAQDLRKLARELFCRERLHVVVVGMLTRDEQRSLRRVSSVLPHAPNTRRRRAAQH